MSITTISKVNPTVITMEESYALAISFPSTEELTDGVPVKLDATGNVITVAADGSDFPLGIVTRGTKTHVWEGRATVVTGFKQVLTVVASGAVTAGGFGIFDSYVAADGLKYKEGTGNALGMFLGAAADGESVQIGIFKTPVTVA